MHVVSIVIAKGEYCIWLKWILIFCELLFSIRRCVIMSYSTLILWWLQSFNCTVSSLGHVRAAQASFSTLLHYKFNCPVWTINRNLAHLAATLLVEQSNCRNRLLIVVFQVSEPFYIPTWNGLSIFSYTSDVNSYFKKLYICRLFRLYTQMLFIL